ncbi:conserved hypothetical protein, membrane [Candidatus Magnetobacterium bavaricum]|uniref:Uncharacterized protein n=1 Tax=Candidatus Magnetobacterium bavaricum TaxID=29290 RepID=A0A0F3GKS4_9BACT|nr:conserved hypothetical protein, membrane [Candidatus Magnetobacterium bavaricum]
MRLGIYGRHYTSHIIMITVLGLLCYSNTFNSPFVFDDAMNITDSPLIRDLRYFTGSAELENTTSNAHMMGIKSDFKARYVGHLTFALNFKLNALDVTGYHIFNLIVHISNATLLYCFIVLIFRTPLFAQHHKSLHTQDHTPLLDSTDTQRSLPLAAALLFVAHPVQTQAVTYIVQRFASLATLFYLCAIVMYIKSRLATSFIQKLSTFAFAVIMAVLAMKTKQISFTLPVVIAMFEIMFLSASPKQRAIYLIPLLLTMSIIPMALIGENNSLMQIRDVDKAMAIASSHDISRGQYLITQFRVIVTYMRLLILPVNQNLDYDYHVYKTLFEPEVMISLAFISSVISVAILLYRLSKNPQHQYGPYLRLLSFGILWFFITLSVESSIIPIADVIFEHRLYLPSVGALIAMVTAATLAVNALTTRMPTVKKLILPLFLLILTILAIATYARNIVWQDKATLWADMAKKSPAKARPHLGLANLYTELGYISDAINQYHIVIRLKPDYADAYIGLSRAYAYLGRYDEAVSQAQIGMKLYKASYRVGDIPISYHEYFATTHFSLGNTFAGWGRMDAALNEYLTAIELKPNYAQAYVSAGNVYATKGRYDEAVKNYQTALEIIPGFPDALQNLYFVQQKQGRPK